MTEYLATTRDRARLLLDLGRPAEAERAARGGLSELADDADLLMTLTRALQEQRRFKEADAVVGRLLASAPDDPAALSARAAGLAARNKTAPALAAVERAVGLNPLHPGLHRQHAAILLARGRRTDALAAAATAVRLAPTDATVATMHARALFLTRQPAAAEHEIARALALEPENGEALRTAGMIGLAGGSVDSVARWRASLREDPTDPRARQGLKQALNARNPVFRTVIRYEYWLATATPRLRWLGRIVPLLVLRTIAADSHGALAVAVQVVLLAFLATTWLTVPVGDLTLLFDREERALLTAPERQRAATFGVFLLLAIGCGSAALVDRRFIFLAFGFGAWAVVTAYATSLGTRLPHRVVAGVAYVAMAMGVVGIVCAALSIDPPVIFLAAALVLSALLSALLAAVTAGFRGVVHRRR